MNPHPIHYRHGHFRPGNEPGFTEPVREGFGIFQRQIDRVVRITKDLQQFSPKPPEMEKSDPGLVESP
jgi:hypothetical protein